MPAPGNVRPKTRSVRRRRCRPMRVQPASGGRMPEIADAWQQPTSQSLARELLRLTANRRVGHGVALPRPGEDNRRKPRSDLDFRSSCRSVIDHYASGAVNCRTRSNAGPDIWCGRKRPSHAVLMARLASKHCGTKNGPQPTAIGAGRLLVSRDDDAQPTPRPSPRPRSFMLWWAYRVSGASRYSMIRRLPVRISAFTDMPGNNVAGRSTLVSPAPSQCGPCSAGARSIRHCRCHRPRATFPVRPG